MKSVDDLRILHLFANYKWTGPADPAIRAAARLRALDTTAVARPAAVVLIAAVLL